MPCTDKTAYLITNHAPIEILSEYKNIRGDVIAVDAGLKIVHQLGLTPACMIGDFDSLEPEMLEHYPEVPVIRHKAQKNETDTELALQYCLEQGYREILICNDMQGRFDHAMGLLQNLLYIHLQGCKGCIESSNQRLFFLDNDSRIATRQQALLSLIPFGGDAEFHSSVNLAYPLENLYIPAHQSRGISNVCLSEEVQIRLKRGSVLAILTIF